MKYLFIDDVLITGIAAKGITHHYDWSKSFLESQTDSAFELLTTKEPLNTPELLVAMDVNSTSILHLNKKSKTCHDHPKCYSLLNQIPTDSIRPKKISTTLYSKYEL